MNLVCKLYTEKADYSKCGKIDGKYEIAITWTYWDFSECRDEVVSGTPHECGTKKNYFKFSLVLPQQECKSELKVLHEMQRGIGKKAGMWRKEAKLCKLF